MFEDIWKSATGPWGLAALVILALPGGRKMVRNVAKEAIKVGLTVSDNVKDLLGRDSRRSERCGGRSKSRAPESRLGQAAR